MFESCDDILTVAEVAELLKVGKTQVYKILKQEKLSGFKEGKDWKISKQALNNYVIHQSQKKK